MYDVVLVSFILPFAVLVAAAICAQRARTRAVRWVGWTFAVLAVLWMAASLIAIAACC
jgi:hypothetical protein